jgi:cystathionine beta-synthase
MKKTLPSNPELRVYDHVLETIGHTPLVRLNRVARGLPCPVYAKLEFFNPGGSIKDRIGIRMIEAYEKLGELTPGGTVVEATSGNTGIGLAIACAIKGYQAIFVMPDKMSQEKIQLLEAFGAKVVIAPSDVEPDDARSYYSVATRIAKETPNAVLGNQYHNPANPESHYRTTGPEILEQTGGRVTDIVIGMGTGGTISGVARYMKERAPHVRMVGVDPIGSILKGAWAQGGRAEGLTASPYKIEGIGEDFIPSTLDLSLVHEVIQVDDAESFRWARQITREEGIFIGGSCGSAFAGLMKYARSLDENRLIVVIFPDSGTRYLSKVYNDAWMLQNGFLHPS